jgi:uncharacterized coiled-coil DUF342 family protein
MTTSLQIQEETLAIRCEHEMKTEINEMQLKAVNLIVDSKESFNSIDKLYSRAREIKKAVEERRKFLVEPFRTRITEINDQARELSDPLDQIIDITNSKTNIYMRLLEEIKRTNDEKLRQAAAIFDEIDELYIPEMAPVRGKETTVVTKIEKKFRLLDITKVPTKYLLVDEATIKRDLKLGISEIPGLEIYEEKTTNLKKKINR